MSKREVLQAQKAMNNFTDKRLLAVPRVEEDGTAGRQTRNRVLQCKWWLGYQENQRDRELDPDFLWRLRNPLTAKAGVAGKDAVKRGQERRDKQKERVRDARDPGDFHTPVTFTQDSWGYHPGVHDGVDLICGENAPLYALCDAEVVRVSDDWWGAGNPGGSKGDMGDGIIALRCLEDDGPFDRGIYVLYGHAEKPRVKEGQRVRAGTIIGHAGLANAWHIHIMVNDHGGFPGTGDRDPAPFYRYAVAHDRS